MHAQVCKRLAGGSDVAVCLEICPDTWEERKELKLHVHAFIKANATDLCIKDVGPFPSRAWCRSPRDLSEG